MCIAKRMWHLARFIARDRIYDLMILAVYANSLLAVYAPPQPVKSVRAAHRTCFRLNSRDFLKSQRSNPGNGLSGSGRQPSAGGQSSSARFTSVQVCSLCRHHVMFTCMASHRRTFIRTRLPLGAPLKSSSRGTLCGTIHCTPETTQPVTSATS